MQKRLIDESFCDAGQKEGLEIWKIDHFKMTRVRKEDYGKFYSGDSYLLLNTKCFKNKGFSWNIHYWLGANSTMDEMATAAIKAIELDDYLGGMPVQYREMQYYESPLFHSYFKNGIKYLQGGVSSGFSHSEGHEHKHEKKLFMVKGKKDVRVIQVPLESSSLNKSDVFILEDGNDIYQLNPPGSNHIEHIKANMYAKKIRDDEHCGKANLIVLEDDDWNTNEAFWSHFNCDPNRIAEKGIEDREFENSFNDGHISLYRISDAYSSIPIIDKVCNFSLKKSMLDSNDCFIVDTGLNGIHCWIGKKCTKNEKISCLLAAKELIIKNNYPKHIPFSQVIDGGETTAFKALFTDWLD